VIGVIEYYVRPAADYRTSFHPGQIYWAPIPFVLKRDPDRLRLESAHPDNPYNASFTIERTDILSHAPGTDPPLRNYGIASDEIFIANPYKKRPAVLLSEPLPRQTDEAQQYDGYLVAPLYSLHDEAGNYKRWATREMAQRAMANQYPNLFYMPPSSELAIPESVARIDRLQFVRLEHLAPRPAALTPDATGLLREWSYHYLGCPLLNAALEQYIMTAARKIQDEFGS
jgi:hypothetical protein